MDAHKVKLELPIKSVAPLGGGLTISSASNFLMVGSHRSDAIEQAAIKDNNITTAT